MKKNYVTPEFETLFLDSDIKTDVITVSGWTDVSKGIYDTGTDFDLGVWGD